MGSGPFTLLLSDLLAPLAGNTRDWPSEVLNKSIKHSPGRIGLLESNQNQIPFSIWFLFFHDALSEKSNETQSLAPLKKESEATLHLISTTSRRPDSKFLIKRGLFPETTGKFLRLHQLAWFRTLSTRKTHLAEGGSSNAPEPCRRCGSNLCTRITAHIHSI